MSLWGKIKKVAKKVIKKVKEIVDDIIDAAKDAADAVFSYFKAIVMDVVNGVKHLAIGLFNLATGNLKGAKNQFKKSYNSFKQIPSDVIYGAVSVGVMLGAYAVSGVQRIFGFEDQPRLLTEDEKTFLREIFEDTVDFEEVRISEGNLGLMGLNNDTAYTVGRRIYISPGIYRPLKDNPDTLVHEITHVWQYENGGPDYLVEAIGAQYFGDDGGMWFDVNGNVVVAPRGYAFDKAYAAGKHWIDFNREQQGTFLGVAFQVPVDFTDLDRLKMMFDGEDYTDELKSAMVMVRAGEGVN